MSELNINGNEVGNEFLISLKKLIDIRKEKKKIYEDTYLTDTRDFLLLQIENKLKRAKIHFENNSEFNDIEKSIRLALVNPEVKHEDIDLFFKHLDQTASELVNLKKK